MPLSELGAALVTAGAQAGLQTAGNVAAASVNSKKSYKYTKKLAEWQNQQNMLNWNTQAAYNSVGAQLARLRAAGLNTNLLYGAGADGGIASAAPEVNPTPMEFQMSDPNLGGAMSTGLSVYQAAAELSNLEARTDLTKQQTLTEMYKTAIASKDYEFADAIKRAQLALFGSQTNLNLSSAEVNRVTVQKINEDTVYQRLVNTFYPALSLQNLKESESRISLNAQQERELQSKIRLNNKTVSRMDVEIEKLRKEIEWVSSQTDLTDAEFMESRKRCERMDAEITKLGKEAGLTDKEIEFYEWNHARTTSDSWHVGITGVSGSSEDINMPSSADRPFNTKIRK